MDNFTHSLAGLAVAEVGLRVRERHGEKLSPRFRLVARTLSVVANNFPDVDLVFARLTPGKLGYLLHHRGFTHTVVFALPQALLLWSLALLWLNSTGETSPPRDRRWLFGLSLLGVLLHIGLDYLNSYGVHPFWPFDPSWHYGDTLFIVEPWLWLSWLPVLVWTDFSRPGRGFVAVLLAVALGLVWRVAIVPTYSALILTAWALVLLVSSRRISPLARASLGMAASLLVILAFAISSHLARVRYEKAFAERRPGWSVHDVALTPNPANPFCWDAIGIALDPPRSTYEATRAMVAPFPSLVPAEHCHAFRWGENEKTTFSASSRPSVRWGDSYPMALAQWQQLIAIPLVSAFLRFARAPFFRIQDQGFWFGDLRYDRGDGGGFATFHLSRDPASLPEHIPSWRPPRSDLLFGGR